ncbi:MAG: hypothetical protein ABIR57_04990 [Aeromicrobium sp.]
MSLPKPPRPEDKYRYIGLAIAMIVLVAALLYTPTWWNDFR